MSSRTSYTVMSSSDTERMRRTIDLAEELIDDLEKISGEIPQGLRRALDRYVIAVRAGLDIHDALREVQAEIEAYYRETYEKCREADRTGEDDYWACKAGVDRRYQAENVRRILGNGNRALPAKLWQKWRPKLSEWLSGMVASRE